MSLASDLLEKMKNKGQLKIKPEPLSSPPEGKGQPADSGQVAPPMEDQGEKGQPTDPLFDKHIAIESRHLDGEAVYLAPNEKMASEVEKKGLIAFTPQEINVMSDLERSMGKDEWISHLKAVFQTKKMFEGTRIV